jgi:O-antigen polymerase
MLLCILSLVYQPNRAGPGLEMPVNLLAWGGMSLLVLCGAATVWVRGEVRLSPRLAAIAFAALLLTLPWLWTPAGPMRESALLRLIGIWAAVLLFWALLQARLDNRACAHLLTALWAMTLLQAVLGVIQLFMPSLAWSWMGYLPASADWRPYGIFQRGNLLGSFLATGIGLAMAGVLTASPPDGSNRKCHLAIWKMLSLVPLWAVLLWAQGRTGVLGGIVMLISLSLWGRRRNRPLTGLWICSVLGITLGLLLPYTSVWPFRHELDLLHTGSNSERLYLLAGTLQMIIEHPLSGWGLGSFEVTWPVMLQKTGQSNTALYTFTHPHNEVLYAWAEGGIVALLGMVILAGTWLWPHNRSDELAHSMPFATAPFSLLATPLILHMMTEYPMYQSALHLFMLVLLLRLAWPPKGTAYVPVGQSNGLMAKRLRSNRRVAFLQARFIVKILSVAVLVGSLGAFIVLMGGVGVQQTLTQWERSGMNDQAMQQRLNRLPRWVTFSQWSRLDYDRHTALLLAFNTTRNLQYLMAYQIWGYRYLEVHNDAEVSAALVQIAKALGNSGEAMRLRARARLSFPRDSRFILPGEEITPVHADIINSQRNTQL